MRFYLCGGLDASDWILANIVTLSTIPSTRVKVLVGYIIQWIAEGTFDVRAEVSDAKACIAALHFMVSDAAKFYVKESILSRELQQLGLPRVPSREVKARQIQLGDTKNVVMHLTIALDKSEVFVVFMMAKSFRVLHHGKFYIFEYLLDSRRILHNMDF